MELFENGLVAYRCKLSKTTTFGFGCAGDLPYLLENKSQLQHLFLLLSSKVHLMLRKSCIFRSIGRTENTQSCISVATCVLALAFPTL